MTNTIVDIELRDGRDGYRVLGTVARAIMPHKGWYSCTYQGKRYQVHGGIRNPLFINVWHPLPNRRKF
jgi:hypothetical protein